MLGIVVLFAFIVMGVLQAQRLFRYRTALTRIWLGSVMGLMEMMWLPSIFAFAMDFTLNAQMWALCLSLLFTLLCALIPGRKRVLSRKKEKEIPLWLVALLVIPASVFAGYLEYTHTIREIGGALYSGQSTYGDLCMHLSFATGLVGQTYPPEYTLLPGAVLGYPFLVDALSSTMLIFGTTLSLSFVIPGTVMISLIYLGFVLFAWKITHRKSATALAFVLLVFNGGLGFLQTGTDEQSLMNALFGFYQTPTNLPDLNLRWVNALCDLLIPQRTLMAGWLCVIPALYLLVCAMQSGKFSHFVGLGLWAGPMVMIHTHSFLALGVISLGALAVCIMRMKGKRFHMLLCFGAYGLIACALAFPQLLEWTFPQTLDGGSLRILFNWVNNNGNGGLIENYFVFWIKNVGFIYLFLFIAGLTAKKTSHRALALGSLLVYVLAEIVVFQPNVYDNNKLFYVAFIAMLPAACEIVVNVYERLKGIRGRVILAVFFVVVSALSGGISIAREVVSGMEDTSYQLFSKSQVEAAQFIRENTPEDAVFLTANNHNNAVASLTGRRIVCGSSLYLYFHGLSYQQNETDAVMMLAYPDEYYKKYIAYNVDYVFVSSYERAEMHADHSKIPPYLRQDCYRVNEEAIANRFELVYEGGEWYDRICIYKVTNAARVLNS